VYTQYLSAAKKNMALKKRIYNPYGKRVIGLIKVGIIGNGKIAKEHVAAYEKLTQKGKAVLEVFCDLCPEAMEGLKNVRIYTDWQEMLEKERKKLDFIDICLPTFLHKEVSVAAMEQGYHVLCEKPMARTEEDAIAMLETSKRTGKTLMIAHCSRFMLALQKIHQLIQSGELGKVRSAEFYRGSVDYTKTVDPNSWFYNGQLSGGGMLDTHIHDVDLIRWLFGMPEAVSAMASSVVTKGGFDAMTVNYIFPDGSFVNALCDWTISADKFNTRTTRVNFENGYIFCDRTPGREAFVKVDRDGNTEEMTGHLGQAVYYHEIAYFVDCLEKGLPVTMCPPEETVDAIRITLAEIESADRRGERIRIS